MHKLLRERSIKEHFKVPLRWRASGRLKIICWTCRNMNIYVNIDISLHEVTWQCLRMPFFLDSVFMWRHSPGRPVLTAIWGMWYLKITGDYIKTNPALMWWSRLCVRTVWNSRLSPVIRLHQLSALFSGRPVVFAGFFVFLSVI